MAVEGVKDPIQPRNSYGDAKRGSTSFSTMSAAKCDWRKPAIKVNHGVTLNLSLTNISSSPPVTAAEEGG